MTGTDHGVIPNFTPSNSLFMSSSCWWGSVSAWGGGPGAGGPSDPGTGWLNNSWSVNETGQWRAAPPTPPQCRCPVCGQDCLTHSESPALIVAVSVFSDKSKEAAFRTADGSFDCLSRHRLPSLIMEHPLKTISLKLQRVRQDF